MNYAEIKIIIIRKKKNKTYISFINDNESTSTQSSNFSSIVDEYDDNVKYNEKRLVKVKMYCGIYYQLKLLIK